MHVMMGRRADVDGDWDSESGHNGEIQWRNTMEK